MRHFILFARKAYTAGKINMLKEAGRLDIVTSCIESSLLLSYKIREDVIFHALLYGRPKPPLYIRIEGKKARINSGFESIGNLLKQIIKKASHNKEKEIFPGIYTSKKSFQEVVKELSKENEIYILHEKGDYIGNVKFGNNVAFIIGDYIGIPKNDERFALRYGKKISLGKKSYFANQCITIINYLLDVST